LQLCAGAVLIPCTYCYAQELCSIPCAGAVCRSRSCAHRMHPGLCAGAVLIPCRYSCVQELYLSHAPTAVCRSYADPRHLHLCGEA
ncbi:hypothetical protein NDU88_008113, partial [Pleurodeles waltl]